MEKKQKEEKQREELKTQYPEFAKDIEELKEWYSPGEIKELIEWHVKILQPVGRVRTHKGGGSGVRIYSKPNPENPEEFKNFAFSNFHVVEGTISYDEDWTGSYHEILEEVSFDVFDYFNLSEVASSNEHKAIVIEYDKYDDIALLEIKTPKKIPYAAQLIKEKDIPKLKRSLPIVIVGCSVLHNPIHTSGQISYINKTIRNKEYLMYNADSYFGNSGGALYLEITKELVGIPARITTIDLGFGVDVVPWMGFGIPPERIHKFIKDKGLLFLVDDKHTYQEYLENKEKRKKSWSNRPEK